MSFAGGSGGKATGSGFVVCIVLSRHQSEAQRRTGCGAREEQRRFGCI